MLFSISSPQLSRFRKNRRSEQKQQANDDSAYSHLFSSEERIMPVELSVSGWRVVPRQQLNLLLVTCYTTCLYVVHSKRALSSGEAQRPKHSRASLDLIVEPGLY